MSLTVERASFDCVGIIIYFLWNLHLLHVWVFTASLRIFFNIVSFFPLNPDLCAMLKNSSAYLHSLVDTKTQS